MKTVNDAIAALREFSDGIIKRKISTFAAAGAYYLFMSLIPMIMMMCAILQYTPLTEELAMGVLSEYVPESMYALVSSIVSTIYSGGGAALTISIVLAIWSSSKSMKAMMRGMDAVYGVEREESIIVFNVRAFIYMIVFAVVDSILNMLKYMRFLVVMVLLALVFMLLYRWMPVVKMGYAQQQPGAAFTAVVWVLFSSIFSLYVSLSNEFGAYGVIGTIIVAMMWMYFCIYFLLIGGYINHFIYLRRDSDH